MQTSQQISIQITDPQSPIRDPRSPQATRSEATHTRGCGPYTHSKYSSIMLIS